MASTLDTVNSLYKGILGRASDKEGANYWSKQIDSGKMSVDQVKDHFSGVRKKKGSQIDAINKAAGGNASGQAFVNYFQGDAPDGWQSASSKAERYHDGQNRATGYLESGFTPKVDYRDDSDNTDFLRNVYLNETGRDADSDGLAYWMGQMDRGVSRDQVIKAFNNTQEGRGYDNATMPKAGTPGQSDIPNGKTSVGILDSILASDSPLMQRAATQGKQYAQTRGLLNSSMAAGASQGAMIDRAQPFALQDSNNSMQNYRQARDHWNQAERIDQRGQIESGQIDQRAENSLDQIVASSAANGWGVTANNIQRITADARREIDKINNRPDVEMDSEAKKAAIEAVIKGRDDDIEVQQGLYDSLFEDLQASGAFPPAN